MGTAVINRRDGGEREQCLFPDLYLFRADAGELKGNLRHWLSAEQFISKAIGGRRMGGHGEAPLARFKGLGFFMHGFLRAPPPLFMHIGAVGWVHQAYDGVINMAI